jgi:hypothetical protein
MRRREFITPVGGTVAWPLIAGRSNGNVETTIRSQ